MTNYNTESVQLTLTTDPLDVKAADAFLRVPSCGAVNLFVGTTRQFTNGKETTELAYDAYEPMALEEMKQLAADVQTRWNVERVVIQHRLGTVPIAQASVVIGVATPHRRDAYLASRFLIDTLKRQIPIWKREHYADGTTEWVEGNAPPSLPDSDGSVSTSSSDRSSLSQTLS